jgi:cytosine/creatinine deaminase
MSFDVVLRNARVAMHACCQNGLLDIGIVDGRIAAMERSLSHDGPIYDVAGNLVVPGLVETHIHLDKTCILDRCTICEGNVQEAVRETARAKLAFTEDDIYARARRTLEKAIAGGTQHLRAHTEIDPRIGLKGLSGHQPTSTQLCLGYRLVAVCVPPGGADQ